MQTATEIKKATNESIENALAGIEQYAAEMYQALESGNYKRVEECERVCVALGHVVRELQ